MDSNKDKMRILISLIFCTALIGSHGHCFSGQSAPNTAIGGLHYIDDDDFQAIFSEIQTVTGHDGTSTRALYNIENYNTDVTQCPYEILDITEGRKDLYIRYWIKMDSTSHKQVHGWRTFFEWKTKDYANGSGFRLIAFINSDENGVPYWHWSEGEDGRALWKINGQVMGDHYGPTTRNSKPIDFIMITQIYGNSNPKHQWIDDIEIWDGIPH
ncbi:MAG TPA: hypothetical protein EYG88_06685 [Desulfocapsa sulfexigens]|nr:hypothetical protein [Desulfocapsa sulfexigens]